MLLFDHAFASPQQNLAADEALLEHAESGHGGEVLRLWESAQHFVALGYTNKIDTEADALACAELNIPILRRASGGGTVLQGPCCLSYALVLDLARPEIATIAASNAWIMQRQAQALAQVLGEPVEVAGHSDLTLGGRKFSGNAQKRKRRFTLFHGTILLAGFRLDLLARTLKMPARRPDYRAERPHQDFVGTLGISRQAVKSGLASTWQARPELSLPEFPRALMRRLIEERYGRPEWNRKF